MHKIVDNKDGFHQTVKMENEMLGSSDPKTIVNASAASEMVHGQNRTPPQSSLLFHLPVKK